MPFNIALTGIKAATVDLEVTGNNIANVSTTGFKESRAEFGDLYANSFLSLGTNPIGDGVRVQNIRQEFTQGNLTFTDNGLDLAINGNGFFVVDTPAGDRRFTRAGAFGIDKDGYIVNNTNMRLQGFQADENGQLGGVLGDIQISNGNLSPARTTEVQTELNLDAAEESPIERVTQISSAGTAVQSLAVGALGSSTPNGYTAQEYVITQADGTTDTLSFSGNVLASQISLGLNTVRNVEASASNTVSIPGTDLANQQGVIWINDVPFQDVASPEDLAQRIADAPSLFDLTAFYDGTDLFISNTTGANITIGNDGLADATTATPTTLTVSKLITDPNNENQTLVADTVGLADNQEITAGGEVTINAQNGVTVAEATGNTDIFSNFTGREAVFNTFDPEDERTYNHATSTTVYDSLGIPHVATMYFVKEEVSVAGAENLWTAYVRIDGNPVGDPLTPNGDPTEAAFQLYFNEDGSLDLSRTPNFLITNWTPVDDNGDPNGADGPINAIDGGGLPLPDPPVSSNFLIDISEVTQYGADFSVLDIRQNGYTTGRLSGLDVAEGGEVFARYTNGESLVLGQVALANFNDVGGLAPVGETTWVETFVSGNPVIGDPGTGTLGAIRSSSLEDSNVDLSQELVNLIIAQRNYQANSKTIETANAVTQSILNIS